MGRKITKILDWVDDIFCSTVMPVFSVQQNQGFKSLLNILLEFWFNLFELGDLSYKQIDILTHPIFFC